MSFQPHVEQSTPLVAFAAAVLVDTFLDARHSWLCRHRIAFHDTVPPVDTSCKSLSVTHAFSFNFVATRVSVHVESPEIARASLHIALPWYTHLSALPLLSLYPLLAYAYYVRYDDWIKSEEWTFLACVSLGAGHALSFLVTRWSAGAKAWITTRKVRFRSCSCSLPHSIRLKGLLNRRRRLHPSSPPSTSWSG